MNFIINGFEGKVLKSISKSLVNDYKPTTCFVIDNSEHGKTRLKENTNYISFKEATFGNYPINWESVIPLDEQIVNSMVHCEVVVLKMMDRLEPYMGKLDYETRKRIYLKHLRFWNHILSENKITHFFSGNIPHENYDYVIYCLCKLRNIETVFLHQTVPDFIMILKTIIPFYTELNNEFLKLKELYQGKNIDQIDLGKRAERVYNSQVKSDKLSTPVYMKKAGLFVRFSKLSKSIIKATSKLFSFSFYKKVFKPELYKIFLYRTFIKPLSFIPNYCYHIAYQRKCSKPDFNTKYIYFPLHYQPELTTVPLGGIYANQLLVVQMLNKYLPDNYQIYIKENPKQTRWGRTLPFYKDIASLSKVRLISKKVDTYKLLRKCVAVATITGTAGWEALFRETPVLIFGDFYYQYADGVFKIKSNNDLKNAINAIISENVKPKLLNTKIYLKAFENVTYSGYYNEIYSVHEKDIDTNSIELYAAIRKYLS